MGFSCVQYSTISTTVASGGGVELVPVCVCVPGVTVLLPPAWVSPRSSCSYLMISEYQAHTAGDGERGMPVVSYCKFNFMIVEATWFGWSYCLNLIMNSKMNYYLWIEGNMDFCTGGKGNSRNFYIGRSHLRQGDQSYKLFPISSSTGLGQGGIE